MAADPNTGGFGRKLREARERRGISLRQIANATKISIGALEALERNHISRLPGGIFSRAFVRSYAIEVGLDPEATIQEFIAQFPHETVTAGHPISAQAEDNEALESHRRMASAFVRLILVSLPIAGLVVYYTARGGRALLQWGTAGRREVNRHRRRAAASAPRHPNYRMTRRTGRSEPAVERSPDLLRVSVAQPARGSRLSSTANRHSRELAAGERQTFEVHREFVLTAGDAAALTVTLNGEDARPLGKPGEVVTTRFSLANFKEYLVSR